MQRKYQTCITNTEANNQTCLRGNGDPAFPMSCSVKEKCILQDESCGHTQVQQSEMEAGRQKILFEHGQLSEILFQKKIRQGNVTFSNFGEIVDWYSHSGNQCRNSSKY